METRIDRSARPSGWGVVPENSTRPVTRRPGRSVTVTPVVSVSPAATDTAPHIVGTVGTSGGSADAVDTAVVMPSAVVSTVDAAAGSGAGRGVVSARMMYWPGGTARNVKAPAASLAVIPVVIDSA